MSHTQGKLTLGKHGVIYGGPFREYARGSAQDQFAMVASAHEDEIEQGVTQEENARRIVACWNALEGVPTEWLENYVFRSVENVIQENAALKAENEKLREEIKNVERAEVFPVPAKDEKLREVTKEFVRAYDRGDPVVLINTIEKMREALEGK